MLDYLEGLEYTNLSFPHKTYYELASDLYENKKNKTFDNGLPSHALWGIYKLFEMANESVKIFSGELRMQESDSDFYAHTKLLEQVETFLKKNGTKLHIIIENNMDKNHPFRKFLNQYKDKISIKKVTDRTFPNHFVVADDTGYRIEEDDTNGKIIAKFNFNNPNIAHKLSVVFDLLEKNSKVI